MLIRSVEQVRSRNYIVKEDGKDVVKNPLDVQAWKVHQLSEHKAFPYDNLGIKVSIDSLPFYRILERYMIIKQDSVRCWSCDGYGGFTPKYFALEIHYDMVVSWQESLTVDEIELLVGSDLMVGADRKRYRLDRWAAVWECYNETKDKNGKRVFEWKPSEKPVMPSQSLVNEYAIGWKSEEWSNPVRHNLLVDCRANRLGIDKFCADCQGRTYVESDKPFDLYYIVYALGTNGRAEYYHCKLENQKDIDKFEPKPRW